MLPEGLHKVRVPLEGNPLGWVNSYVIPDDDGFMLVDCGWDTPDSLAALRRGLEEIGLRLEGLHTLVVTHNHPDHYGMAGRLVKLTGCRLVMHRLDTVLIDSRYVDFRALMAEMEQWLRVHGVPPSDVTTYASASMSILNRVNLALPDRPVEGGERITAGRMEWEVVWTPGHSAGHICLYERNLKLFLSGDHILNPITPIISLHVAVLGNPLADYLSSLREIRDYDVELVLPAHGEEFTGFQQRIDDLLKHHDDRLRQMLGFLASGPKTAYEVARAVRWNVDEPWDEMPPFQRRLATTETLAHLELLHSRGQIRRWVAEGGIIRYALPGP